MTLRVDIENVLPGVAGMKLRVQAQALTERGDWIEVTPPQDLGEGVHYHGHVWGFQRLVLSEVPD